MKHTTPKAITAMLLGAAMLASKSPCFGDDFQDNRGYIWSYSEEDGNATLWGVERTNGGDVTGTLTIPSAVDGYPVTAIGESSFQNLGITRLVIANSVKTIGSAAFNSCDSLESIDMGNGLETIEGDDEWRIFETAEYGYVDRDASEGAFGLCSALRTITFSPKLTSIGHHAFSECRALESLAFPESLQRIGYVCFYHATSLTNVTFGTKLELIEDYSFAWNNELKSVSFTGNYRRLTIGEHAFQCDGSLESLTLSESIVEICAYAFASCSSLKSLTLPDSIKRVGTGAFASCTKLQSLDMGNGLETIEGDDEWRIFETAEYGYVDRDASEGAFGLCSALRTITFSPKLTSIGHHAFSECRALESLAFPESLQRIGYVCFYHATSLTSVSFGTKLETIGEYAFARCMSLRAVDFVPASGPRLTIQEYAFAYDTSLTSITFSGILQTLSAYAFYECPALVQLIFSSISMSFESDVFSYMGNVRKVVFLGLPPTGLDSCGLSLNARIQYSADWEEEWLEAIDDIGFTNASVYVPDEGGNTTSSGNVSLTVTNIVIHYVAQSVPSGAVIPPMTAGIVNIVTEIGAGNAVAIPSEWAAQYPGFAGKFGNDFGAAVTMQTGKRDGAGNPMFVWQDFVAGTDPTDTDDVFRASITFDTSTGTPVISWTPELSAAEAAKRSYKTFGKVRLNDHDWTLVDGDAADYNFFKVAVEMK